ncbi:MAG: hypothetical protein R3B90_17475 [Planctomycetaceae bacterium]
MKRSLIIAACAVAFVQQFASADDMPAEKVTFADHVLPIFKARCGSCHNANDRKRAALFSTSTRR